MEKEKLVPAIRFKGFDEEWKEKKIKQILIPIVSNLTMLYIQEKGLYPVYDANNIVGYSSYALSSAPYLTIIKDGAGVGRTRKLPANSSFLGTMTGLIPKNSDIDFTYNLMSSLKLEKNFSGSTIPHIYFSDYGKYLVYVPSIIEQQKIGQFFLNLDSLIHSQELKLEKLQTIKQSLLNKMFASFDQKMPEIRFKGFDQDWEKKLIGDIILSIPYKKYINWPSIGGIFPVIQQGNVPISGFANGSPFMNYKNVMIFGDHTLSIYKSNTPFFLASDGVRILQSRNNVPLEFLYRIVEKYLPMSHGYTRHYSILKRQEVTMPLFYDEQEKIGQFFSNLDSLIHSQEQILEKLNNIKQALLEKMFC
ncbi:restriction endonuclease subunit S [Mycoplasma sp. VS299A]|uniref:restriction endonuclease subunit S n=1 Tax=Mycoplasma sp. VS299A TaxID=3401690 RepID=UPI003AAA7EFC